MDISSASKAELKEIAYECMNDRKFACKTLFPERFELPFSEAIHDKIFDMIKSGVKKGAIAAPRGIGKTSIVNIALPATELLYRESKFIVPVSATASSAVMQSESLKWELRSNPIIKGLFGNMESAEYPFNKELWTAANFEGQRFPGTGVMPRGAGQQIRGLNYYGMRPDFIIVDDLEDPQKMDSEEQRKKKLKWFYADLLKAIPRHKPWRIFVIGTILHEDSLLNNLLESPDWESEMLELCDEKNVSNWPQFISDKEVQEEYDEHNRLNMLDVFYREYRNLAGADGLNGYDAGDWTDYDENDPLDDFHARGHLPTAVIVDPAKTVTMHSAESAIVGVSVDTEQNLLWWRQTLGLKIHPDELYDMTADMAIRINADVIAVEVTSLHEFITQPMKDHLATRGWKGEFIELHATGKKEDRIMSLVSYSRQKRMRFNKGMCERLKGQLLAAPRAKLVDVSDAAGYITKLMAEGQMEFGLRDMGDYDSSETIQAEMDEIGRFDSEEPLQSFRII
jgi:hypothetical protein